MDFSLHSTMFLLILRDRRDQTDKAYNFTFHYVSINTRMATQEDFDKFYFTFHYVSINTRMLTPEYLRQITLHSTMFLLILAAFLQEDRKLLSLHSTMFLLILPWRTSISKHAVFTFHYVSINTRNSFYQPRDFTSLHSTMFLLIPERSQSKTGVWKLYIPLCFY